MKITFCLILYDLSYLIIQNPVAMLKNEALEDMFLWSQVSVHKYVCDSNLTVVFVYLSISHILLICGD